MNVSKFVGKFVKLKRYVWLGRVISENLKKDRVVYADDVMYIKNAKFDKTITYFYIIDKDLKEDVIEFNTYFISDESLSKTFEIID